MNLLERILLFPSLRRRVEPSSLTNYRDFLRKDLQIRKLKNFDLFTDHVLDRLVTEAYRIAAEQEEDNIARHGRMYDAVQAIADETALALQNRENANPIVRRILIHNGMTQEGAESKGTDQ